MKKINNKEKKRKNKKGVASGQLRKDKLLEEVRELRSTLPFMANTEDISRYKVLGRP
ncbi:MAG: hypothetical protein FMNOHCHN_01796 [Ignavibacteriaceae bacterium]|nr:hypothetical protein [Ignavibacteriaceae bacterium]